MPWEFFLGHASHRMIAHTYGARHTGDTVFYNTTPLEKILKGIGDTAPSLLNKNELLLRPDITNITILDLFEIKPHGEQARASGVKEAHLYVTTLNRAMPPDSQFKGGVDFDGEVLIKFGPGQHIWKLEWCTTAPGLIQYRWTRSSERFNSLENAYQAGAWVELTEQELKQYGGWVAQVTEGLVDRREKLSALTETIGVLVEAVGGTAMLLVSTATPLKRGGVSMSGQSPPGPAGARILPFPTRAAPVPTPLPKASGL